MSRRYYVLQTKQRSGCSQWPVALRTLVRTGWQGWKEVWPSGDIIAVGWLHPMQTDSLTLNPQNGKWAECCWWILHGEPSNNASRGGGLYRHGAQSVFSPCHLLGTLLSRSVSVLSSEGKEMGSPVTEKTPFK